MAKKSKRAKERRKKLVVGGDRAPILCSPAEIERLKDLWDRRETGQALIEGERLLKIHPKDPQIHVPLGLINAQLRKQAKTFEHLDIAERLVPSSPEFFCLQANLYESIGLHAHALRAARRSLALGLAGEEVELVSEIVQVIESLMVEWATRFGTSVKRMEQGSLLMEQGRLAVDRHDYALGLRYSKEAARLLPEWATPRNNVALALFQLGKVEEAIATEERVLAELDRNNIHALANLAMFRTVLGQTEQAQPYGDRLEKLAPVFQDDKVKMVEALIVLKRDHALYDLLSMIEPQNAGDQADREWNLGVAAANMGKMRQARSHLARAQVEGDVFRSKLARLIREGLPGPGGRYPYRNTAEYLPKDVLDRSLKQLGVRGKGAPTAQDLVRRYPALVDVAAESLWLFDDEGAKDAINALTSTGSARAAELLRAFATGRVGSDELRTQAAMALAAFESVPSHEPITIIKDGKPTPMLVREIKIVSSKEALYSREIHRLLEEAIIDQREGRGDKAEQLYQKILAKNPNVKEAVGNLGVLYVSRGDRRQGEAYIEKALKVDPLYVTARANLASIHLTNGALEEAKELLKPLANVREFHVEEMVLYLGVMARVAVAEKHFDQAENHLRLLMELDPDNEWAAKIQLGIKLAKLPELFEGIRDEIIENQKRHRERRRKLPISPVDALPSLLSRYSKDALVGMAREIFLPSISGLKKDALIAAIHGHLLDVETLEKVFQTFGEMDRAALRFVLRSGGALPSTEFAERYGDEAEESPYWNWRVPKTVLGRLKARGLLFEGTYEGRVLLVVPAELRARCQKLLSAA